MVDKAYTKEQKEEFLTHVAKISEAMGAIMRMEGGGHIINEVGLDAYPFDQSFDELYFAVMDWEDTIRTEIAKKRKPTKVEEKQS